MSGGPRSSSTRTAPTGGPDWPRSTTTKPIAAHGAARRSSRWRPWRCRRSPSMPKALGTDEMMRPPADRPTKNMKYRDVEAPGVEVAHGRSAPCRRKAAWPSSAMPATVSTAATPMATFKPLPPPGLTLGFSGSGSRRNIFSHSWPPLHQVVDGGLGALFSAAAAWYSRSRIEL